jgi:hypothetical protein
LPAGFFDVDDLLGAGLGFVDVEVVVFGAGAVEVVVLADGVRFVCREAPSDVVRPAGFFAAAETLGPETGVDASPAGSVVREDAGSAACRTVTSSLPPMRFQPTTKDARSEGTPSATAMPARTALRREALLRSSRRRLERRGEASSRSRW